MTWLISGNAGTNSSSNFLGTTDNQGLTIRTSNQPRVTVQATGNVGIGTASPQRPLHVHGHEVHSGGPIAGFSFGNRETAAFTDSPGERWVWYSSGGVARLWSAGDKIRVTTSGDLQLMGADCAEAFDVEGDVEPGTVVVLAGDGAVRASTDPYDSRVAGIVAGAGTYKPGIVLDAGPSAPSRRPITLAGKVFCKADASRGAIRVGDLLTTSSVEGHAMRVTDPRRALGAVVGKALVPLDAGRGLIPVLMALQ